MKNKTGKFLCLALIQSAHICCMEHAPITDYYPAIRNDDYELGALEKQEGSFKIDFTKKLCGNKKLNEQFRKILQDQNTQQIRIIIKELEEANTNPNIKLKNKDRVWISRWLESLYEVIGKSSNLENQNYGNWQTVIPTKDEYVEIDNQESTEYKTAELVEWKKNDDNVEKEVEKDIQKKQFETDKESNTSPIEDLSKSIQYIHELDQQTKEVYNKVVEAQKNLETDPIEATNDTKRLEEAKNLLDSLQKIDSQKLNAIKIVEAEIEKLDKQAKNNKDLEIQVIELKKTLSSLKEVQKEEMAVQSGWFSWFNWWPSKK